MPRNASGTYSLPESAFVAGTTIQSAPMNSNFSDISTALTTSLATTGVSSMTGPIKAASGTAAAPSIAFASDADTGFYLAGTNQIGIATAGVSIATFNAAGTVTFSGAVTFSAGIVSTSGSFSTTLAVTGAVTLSSTLAVTGAVTLSSTLAVTGASTLTGTITFGGAITNSIVTISTTGYVDMVEISAPVAPSANTSRIYSKDDGAGVTRLFHQDSASNENTLLMPATQTQQEAATSNLVGVTPGTQYFHPVHPKAGGKLNGTGTPAFESDYGMGSVTDNGTGNYTLNFDTAFSDLNFWANGWARASGTTRRAAVSANSSDVKTTTSFQIRTDIFDSSANPIDSPEVGITFWGDYA